MNDSEFVPSQNLDDRRLENHHRPLVWRPERSWPPYKSPFTDLAHALGQTILENRITDNDAAAKQRLESSSLAAALGINDIRKPEYPYNTYVDDGGGAAGPVFAAQPNQGGRVLFDDSARKDALVKALMGDQ